LTGEKKVWLTKDVEGSQKIIGLPIEERHTMPVEMAVDNPGEIIAQG
jgi:hypothetical protein